MSVASFLPGHLYAKQNFTAGARALASPTLAPPLHMGFGAERPRTWGGSSLNLGRNDRVWGGRGADRPGADRLRGGSTGTHYLHVTSKQSRRTRSLLMLQTTQLH